MSSPIGPTARRGFGLVELLVTLGVLGLFVSIAIPVIAGARFAARRQVSVSNLRTLAMLTSDYASDNDGFPPVLFEPVYGNISGEPQYVTAVDGTELWGHWFSNTTLGHARFDEAPPTRVLRDPSAPGLRDGSMVGAMRYFTDYKLADCLYAEPRYWDRDTQEGPAQWRAQRLDSISFPSGKGLAKQITVYDVEGYPDGYPTCCVETVPSAVVWGDLSGTVEVQAELAPGVPNFWHHGLTGRMNIWSKGIPIDSTRDGVLGRDR